MFYVTKGHKQQRIYGEHDTFADVAWILRLAMLLPGTLENKMCKLC